MSLNFSELFIIGKYIKIRFKNWGSPCYFLSSRGQKIKILQKHTRLFLFTLLLVLFLWRFSRKNWFTQWIYDLNSCLAHFYGQDHLLKLIILGVYAKVDLNVHVFQDRNWCSTKSDRIFFLALVVRRPFHRKNFKWKKIWWYRASFWKNGSFTCRT